MKIFCDRLKELREDKGLKVQQLEKELNLGNGTIGRWEKEQTIPSIEYLCLLADYFGVTPNFLLGYED